MKHWSGLNQGASSESSKTIITQPLEMNGPSYKTSFLFISSHFPFLHFRFLISSFLLLKWPLCKSVVSERKGLIREINGSREFPGIWLVNLIVTLSLHWQRTCKAQYSTRKPVLFPRDMTSIFTWHCYVWQIEWSDWSTEFENKLTQHNQEIAWSCPDCL